MKKILTITIGLSMCSLLGAQDLPQPSPMGEVEQVVGLTKIEIDYSRPSAKERKIFGELVPFGEMWRTGANKNTTIEFDDNVTIEGKVIEKGEYALFTIPNEGEWEFILSKKTDHWGTGDYSKENDVLRFMAKPQATEFTETMTFEFADVRTDRARIELRWEKTRVGFEVVCDPTEKAMANIKEAIADPEADFRTYNSSARYCVDNNMNLEQALEWSTKSVEMEKKFWNVYTLSLCQAANGMHKEAIKTAELSMQLAQEAEYMPYIKMNKENIDKWRRCDRSLNRML